MAWLWCLKVRYIVTYISLGDTELDNYNVKYTFNINCMLITGLAGWSGTVEVNNSILGVLYTQLAAFLVAW